MEAVVVVADIVVVVVAVVVVAIDAVSMLVVSESAVVLVVAAVVVVVSTVDCAVEKPTAVLVIVVVVASVADACVDETTVVVVVVAVESYTAAAAPAPYNPSYAACQHVPNCPSVIVLANHTGEQWESLIFTPVMTHHRSAEASSMYCKIGLCALGPGLVNCFGF